MTSENASPCRHAGVVKDELVEQVIKIVSELSKDSLFLRSRGISVEEYERALPIAVQRMRGSTAADNSDRRQFLLKIFETMLARGLITAVETPDYGKDTVYRLRIKEFGDVAIIQKGCPDGAHSSHKWKVPDWAKETYLWWYCPSSKNEPGEHIAKGVSRLKSRFFDAVKGHDAARMIDAVIFHSDLCGTSSRPCPKQEHSVEINARLVPPPCIYTFPAVEKAVTEWNWNGGRELEFPKLLFALFGIRHDERQYFGGHIGFQAKGAAVRTSISCKFGLGQTTTMRT